MMPIVKHFDPIMGVDIHIVTIPPVGPVPIPHPHISLVIDPMDYVPIMGATVLVGGIPRGTAGTAGKVIPHIPMGGPFVKPPGNEDEIFMGSATVLADDSPLSFTALPILSCQDVGMISPPRKKPKKTYGMVLPTSIVTAIPTGLPVLVGGPPTIDMMGLAMAGGLAALGGALKKLRALQKRSKRIKKISDAIHRRAKKAMDKLGVPPNIRNKVHKSICTVTGHPVDVASGKLFTDWVDFELPGPIPLKWERTWYSTSVYSGPLGHGWHHNYDLELLEDDKALAIRLADGRPVAFPLLQPGEASFDRAERLTLIRDSRGYALDTSDGLRYRFELADSQGKRHLLRAISHKSTGVRISFEYDGEHRLRQIIDSAGRFIRLEYNTEGLLRKIYLPHPATHRVEEWFCAVEYHYSDGQLVGVDDAMKQRISYTYQDRLLVKETYRNGLSFYFRFDGRDQGARCVETWGDKNLYRRSIRYDLSQNITQVTDSLGYVTCYHHDGVLPHRIIDPRNNEESIEYNRYSQVVRTTNALGFKTFYEYDEAGNNTKIVQADSSTIGRVYDQNNNLVEFEDPAGGKRKFRYNNHNRLVAETDPLGSVTTYAYDDISLVAIVDGKKNEYRLDYDQHLNLRSITDDKGAGIQWEYDALGNPVAATDVRGNKRRFSHDILGRVVEISEPDGNLRQMEYDPYGNLLRVRDKYTDVQYQYQGLGRLALRSQDGHAQEFFYDTEERLTAISNEQGRFFKFELDAMGDVTSESGFDGLTRRYLRDALGQVRRVQRPAGRHSSYAYDPVGRVIEILHHNGDREKFEFRPDGALLKVSNNLSAIEFQRDLLGRVTKESRGDFWVASEYDVLGYRTSVTSSLGYLQRIEWDSRGKVTSVTAGIEKGFTTRFARDDFGLELERSMPGGLQSRWQRDKLGRPLKHQIATAENVCAAKTYMWGVADRLSKVVDALGRETLFHHDVLGNLTAARYSENSLELRLPDAVGNLYRTEGRNDREYGPGGQLLAKRDKQGSTRYQYDAEGNLIAKIEPGDRVWRYEWNSGGSLQSVVRPDGGKVLFEYDPLGRRISKSFAGKVTRWIWDGNNPLHEWVEPSDPTSLQRPAAESPLVVPPGGDSVPATWVFDPESFSPMGKLVGDQYFPIVADYLGIPLAMFDPSGEKVWSADLGITGQLRNLQGERRICPFRWPGQYEDEETGLYYNRFRYYDPDAGQYVSQDPIGLLGGLRFYAYVADTNIQADIFGLKCTHHASNPKQAHAAIKDKWGHTMNRNDMRELQSAIDHIKTRNRSRYPDKDGSPYKNSHEMDTPTERSQRLDTGGSYEEWTVKTPGLGNRGERRIVIDRARNKAYYTHDHYKNFIELDLAGWN